MAHYMQNHLSFEKNKGFGKGVFSISNSDSGHPITCRITYLLKKNKGFGEGVFSISNSDSGHPVYCLAK